MAFDCQLLDDDNHSLSLSPACIEHENATVMEIFGSLVPNCDTGAWSATTTGWLAAFYIHLILFGVSFLLIGIACLIFLSKRHLAQRFKTKTFIAIDLALAILGFSKVLFFIFDPYGISGYCGRYFACIVFSRILFALGFPSLTAAYTLVFLTLWYSARMRLGRSCIQKWKIIIPLCFIHYFVAVIFEFVGLFGNSYYILFLLISCEVVFTLWGLIVCATFLIGGIRLLQSVNTSVRESSIVSRDVVVTERETMDGRKLYTRSHSTMKLRPRRQHKQALRKVGIITYTSAILGALYSLLGVVQLVMMCMLLFGECEEESNDVSQNSNLWLSLKYVGALIEVLLAILLIYSINDVRPLIVFVKGKLNSCGGRRAISQGTPDGLDDSRKDKSLFQYTSSIKTSSRSSSPVAPNNNSMLPLVVNNGEGISPNGTLVSKLSTAITSTPPPSPLNHALRSPPPPPSTSLQNTTTISPQHTTLSPQHIDLSSQHTASHSTLQDTHATLSPPPSLSSNSHSPSPEDTREDTAHVLPDKCTGQVEVSPLDSNGIDVHETNDHHHINDDINDDVSSAKIPSRNGRTRVTFSKHLPNDNSTPSCD